MTQEYHIYVQIDLLTCKGMKVDILFWRRTLLKEAKQISSLHLDFMSLSHRKAVYSQVRKKYALHILAWFIITLKFVIYCDQSNKVIYVKM